MSDWINKIVRIENIIKHPNANALSIATVMGDYPVVCKLDQYKIGQLVGYFSINTILPDTEEFHFLSPKQYEKYEENGELKQKFIGYKYPVGSVPEKSRVLKAKKFLGVYSQGMLIDCPEGMNEGDDLVEYFNLKKLQEEEEENISKIKLSPAAPAPKDFKIPYYDLESVRKYLKLVENEKDIILTEKLNGSNFSCVYHKDEFFVKSRNLYKRTNPEDHLYDENDMWIEASLRYNLKDKLKNYPDVILFAECVNQIKNFKYTSLKNTELYFFDAYSMKENKYLDFDEFISLLNILELKHAPILYRGPWTSKDEMYNLAEGKSSLNDKIIKEGWVLSLAKEKYDPTLNGRLKLKFVSESYNLQK